MLPLLAGSLAGLALFINGFRRIRLRRHILGLATSKVRSLAMGTVELSGLARMLKPVTDPIFNQPCAYYNIRVKEKRGADKHTHWVTVYDRNTNAIPFLLEDSTGSAAIFPHGAELHFSFRIVLNSSGFGRVFTTGTSSTDPIDRFLTSLGGAVKTLRLEADILRHGEPLFVLGYAGSMMENTGGGTRLSVGDIARELKKNPQKMKALDINKDGVVDEHEWESGLKDAVEERNRMQGGPALSSASMPIIKKGPDGPFVLADSEENLLSKFGWGAWLQVVAGGGIVIFCFYSLEVLH